MFVLFIRDCNHSIRLEIKYTQKQDEQRRPSIVCAPAARPKNRIDAKNITECTHFETHSIINAVASGWPVGRFHITRSVSTGTRPISRRRPQNANKLWPGPERRPSRALIHVLHVLFAEINIWGQTKAYLHVSRRFIIFSRLRCHFGARLRHTATAHTHRAWPFVGLLIYLPSVHTAFGVPSPLESTSRSSVAERRARTR